ncbi:hypothetical protein KC460_00305 [Candidatus Dependentiae bacterium]|nr:hypothetical protein [Candidatus Dependentiae bacterium]
MKKQTFGILLLAAGSIGLAYISGTRTMAEDTWNEPQDGYFNEVRVVCIKKTSPTGRVLTGADSTMRDAGVDKKIEVTKENGQYACYVKFFYNPDKEFYAMQKCGGRRRYAEGQYDHVYSSLKQLPCGITFLKADMIEYKINNPMEYAVYINNLVQAVNYIKTGILP